MFKNTVLLNHVVFSMKYPNLSWKDIIHMQLPRSFYEGTTSLMSLTADGHEMFVVGLNIKS